jgi:small subunit ribosomal protein S13
MAANHIGDSHNLSEYRHIIRVAGRDLDGSKQLPYGLLRIYGIGLSMARAIVRSANLPETKLLGTLSEAEHQRLEDIIRNPTKYGIPEWLLNRRKDMETGLSLHITGPDLALHVKNDIEFMKNIRCWKGVRHSLGLKVRGQRTRTTGRTGKTVGVRRKEAAKQAKG